MSDHADVIQEALKKHHLNTTGVSRSYNPTQTYKDNQEAAAALAALDALVAERDEALREYEEQREFADEQYRKALAAEARVRELEAEVKSRAEHQQQALEAADPMVTTTVWHGETADDSWKRAEAAEARVAVLEAALREANKWIDESIEVTGCTMDELLATTPGNEYTYLASAQFTIRAALADLDEGGHR